MKRDEEGKGWCHFTSLEKSEEQEPVALRKVWQEIEIASKQLTVSQS